MKLVQQRENQYVCNVWRSLRGLDQRTKSRGRVARCPSRSRAQVRMSYRLMRSRRATGSRAKMLNLHHCPLLLHPQFDQRTSTPTMCPGLKRPCPLSLFKRQIPPVGLTFIGGLFMEQLLLLDGVSCRYKYPKCFREQSNFDFRPIPPVDPLRRIVVEQKNHCMHSVRWPTMCTWVTQQCPNLCVHSVW